MRRRILSLVLAALLMLSVLPVTVSADDGDYGWAEMKGDIAFRISQNGSEVTRLIVGETYQLQVWIQDIGPFAIAIPIGWDPSVVQVVDTKTGAPVTSGKKLESESTGFYAGSKCYQGGIDPWTDEPLYWNGRPVFTRNEEAGEGYPTLNAEEGHYRFLYYVSSPNPPLKAQMILEVYFQVIGSGDPDFHVSTWRDGFGCYDPVQPDGISVVIPYGGDSTTVTYGDRISIPNAIAMTLEQYEAEAAEPPEFPEVDFSDAGKPGASGSSDKAELVPTQHLSFFPYSSAVKTAAVLKSAEGNAAKDSDNILPASKVTEAIGKSRDSRSILVEMPDKMLEKKEYALVIKTESLQAMADAGIPMLYVETPWAYVGLNAAALASQTRAAEARLSVKQYTNAVKVAMTLDGKNAKDLSGAILRIILPYDKEKQPEDTIPVPLGYEVFGSGQQTNQPLSLYKVDEAHGALIFLATGFTGFSVSSGSRVSFDDMDSVQWAVPYVENLAQRKIIKGTGEGKFTPNAAVTREQFAKMLVSTLAMYQSSPKTSFADVPAGEYFYPFVASAQMTGVINGVSDEAFGTGSTITRQDLITMTFRALQLMGVALPGTTTETDTEEPSTEEAEVFSFTDDESIADYARPAVYQLYEAGIVSGVGDDRFDPTGTATRAQAAKILSCVLELVLDTM